MIFTRGLRASETAPTRHECDIPALIAWLRDRPVYEGPKDGEWVCFADFGGQQRALANLVGSHAIPLDFDGREPLWPLLDAYTYAAWTTHGHQPAAPRWRVVVFADRPMTADEHRATWQCLSDMTGGADPAAKDASRLNYLRGACINPQAAQWRENTGALFPVCAAADVPSGTTGVAGTADGLTSEPVPGWDGPTDDDQLIAYMRANRRSAEDAFGTTTRFEALWTADAAYLAVKFPHAEQGFDHTKADAALANELAYYTGGHGERCAELFARSALAARESWRPDKARRAILLACTGRTQYAFMRTVPAAAEPAPQTPGVLEPSPTIPNAKHLTTDLANAQRLVKHYGPHLLSAAGEFYAWTGTHWQAGMREPTRLAATLSAIIADEIKPLRDRHALLQAAPEMTAHLQNPRKISPTEEWEMLDKLIPALEKWAAKSEQASVIAAALSLLKTMLDVPMTTFDTNPWLLNCRNGTVDLRTGALSPHNPADRITRCVPLDYSPGATCPRFVRFMHEVFPDAPTVDYLHRYFGYSITGSNREQTMLVHWGKGSNGKNTLHKAIRGVIGPYGQVGPPGLLTNDKGGQFVHEIADLYGARWVSVDESDDGARMKEAAMKQMTGDDNVRGRHLYKSFFEYRPTYKLHLMTNHKPRIANTDHGVWRRIKLVPYVSTFSGDAADPTLDDRLAAEAPGILAWLVEGARLWFAEGKLRPSAFVEQASAEYRGEEDMIGTFLAERCVLEPGADVATAALYAAYAAWAKENGAFVVSKKRLTTDLLERPLGITSTRIGAKNTRSYVGIKLQPT